MSDLNELQLQRIYNPEDMELEDFYQSKIMKPQEQIREIQTTLKNGGFYAGEIDGLPGKKTHAAFDECADQAMSDHNAFHVPGTANILKGDGTWPWHAEIDGEDILVRGARGTCFGGTDDPQDSGETASGVSTKDPSVLGCALPRAYTGNSASLRKALGGSPIPTKLPFKTMVEVTVGGFKTIVPFIDIGPAKYTGNALDLTIAAAKKFDPKATARNFEIRCDYRIVGGAQFA